MKPQLQKLQQQWLKLSTKLDAMTLRERAMLFLAATASILFVMYSFRLEPLLEHQKNLMAQIRQQQNQINGIDAEISIKAQGFQADPDAAEREHLRRLREETVVAGTTLQNVQKGLVAPNKIVPVLEHLLRSNGKLKLVSLKTLPVAGMNETAAWSDAEQPKSAGDGPPAPPAAGSPAANMAALSTVVGIVSGAGGPAGGAKPAAETATGASAAPAVKPRELLYRHGVEIVLQGSYLDMVNYMDALEALPVQLFWGKAQLDAGQYPNSRLTLTLYTLSLDSNWMKL